MYSGSAMRLHAGARPTFALILLTLALSGSSLAAAPCALNPASPSVTICTPANNANVASPVTVTAGTTDNAHPVTAMIVYLDNVNVYKVNSNQLSTSLAMAAGKHNITINAWDSTGAVFKSTVLVTAGSAPPPPPPPSGSGDVTVNFNNRSGGGSIPAGLFGAQLGNLTNVQQMQQLVDAGISGTRLYANVQSVFASSTPNWAYIDPTLDKLQSAGMKAILMISNTPTWLQPSPNPCSEIPTSSNAHPYNAAPKDNNAYASIAAQYVSHIDHKYPGLVQYYEIWNEADEMNQFCGLHSGDPKNAQARLDEYKPLYNAVASAMKAQAAKDGTSIKVGGPALGNYYGSNYWISQLVQSANSGGAHLLDFVSYHQYPAGSDVSHTMTWNGANGTVSLYSRTMNGTTGLAAIYKSIASAAGSNVPVLLDEFNDDWDFYNDCCKNKPPYSSLWNTLVFATILNTAYAGAPPLAHLSYYSALNQPFCLMGYTGDGQYGCGSSSPLPYPQFRAFELLASPHLLDLQSHGGHLALSVATSSALNSAGLVVAAFYTQGSNAIVLVNPTGTAITGKTLLVQNHGLAHPSATQYLLNGSTYSPVNSVGGSNLPVAVNGSSLTATVAVPAYSVLAIKLE